jgi:hypothetical protein
MRPIRLRLGHFAHFTLEAQQMRATRVATLSHSAVCVCERERESERERVCVCVYVDVCVCVCVCVYHARDAADARNTCRNTLPFSYMCVVCVHIYICLHADAAASCERALPVGTTEAYIYIHTYIYTYTYTYTYTYIICMYVCIYIHTYICVCVCVCVYYMYRMI